MAHRTSHRNRPAAGLPATTAAGLSGTRTQSAPAAWHALRERYGNRDESRVDSRQHH